MANKYSVCTLYSHTHPFNGPFSGTTRVSQYQKGKPIWILRKQETVSISGISWAICKSAPSSRQITTATPLPLSFFTGRMLFLPPNQHCQSTEGLEINSAKAASDCYIFALIQLVEHLCVYALQFVNEDLL